LHLLYLISKIFCIAIIILLISGCSQTKNKLVFAGEPLNNSFFKIYQIDKNSTIYSVFPENKYQMENAILELKDALDNKKITIKDIGIISPYREQKKELEARFGTELKVDTIHKFQGREEEAIILTTVDNEIGEFVDDPKMLNVAVTRAKRFLRVVVSDSENNVGTNIDDLIKYIQYNNFEVVESKTKSIYDMLYKGL